MRNLINIVETAMTQSPLDDFFSELARRGIAPLNELQNIKQHSQKQFSNRKEFTEYMINLGFQEEGFGAMGAVFSHPKLKYVLKIFQLDEAYRQYIDYCIKNKTDKHLPKFIGNIIKIFDGTYMVRLEKLEAIGGHEFATLIRPAIEAAKKALLGMIDYRNPNLPERLKQNNEGLLQTLMGIFQTFSSQSGIRTDLHVGNFMRRGPVYVVTDPIIDSSTNQENRLPFV